MRGISTVRLLSWTSTYDMRSDGSTLTDGACKQFLEELLSAVRHGLERVRTSSSSRSKSVPASPATSVDPREVDAEKEKNENYEDDMRYYNLHLRNTLYLQSGIENEHLILKDDIRGGR